MQPHGFHNSGIRDFSLDLASLRWEQRCGSPNRSGRHGRHALLVFTPSVSRATDDTMIRTFAAGYSSRKPEATERSGGRLLPAQRLGFRFGREVVLSGKAYSRRTLADARILRPAGKLRRSADTSPSPSTPGLRDFNDRRVTNPWVLACVSNDFENRYSDHRALTRVPHASLRQPSRPIFAALLSASVTLGVETRFVRFQLEKDS